MSCVQFVICTKPFSVLGVANPHPLPSPADHPTNQPPFSPLSRRFERPRYNWGCHYSSPLFQGILNVTRYQEQFSAYLAVAADVMDNDPAIAKYVGTPVIAGASARTR